MKDQAEPIGPRTYESHPLGSLCTVIAGQSPKGSAYNDAGQGLPFYQGKKEFTERFLAPPTTWTTQVTKRAEPNDILMSVRAPVGPINETNEAVCIGRGLAAIRAGRKIDRGFLWYALLWLQPEIVGNAGAVFPSINKKGIESLKLPLPPLEEQRRIVAVLDQAFAALDRARAHAEANLADAEELFDSWLTAVFHDHPDTWRVAKLNDLCRKITVGHVGPMAKRYVGKGVPFLRSQNIRPFELNVQDVKYIDDAFVSELKKSELTPGDVAIVRTGYPGTAAVIPKELPLANCADLVIARPNAELSPGFLAMFLNSSFGKSMVAGKVVGAAQKHFNVGAAKQVDFAFPDIQEQERIVKEGIEMRSASAAVAKTYADKLNDIADLRQSLLQKAFSGQLTV